MAVDAVSEPDAADVLQAAVDPIAQYVELQARIKALEEQAAAVRADALTVLGTATAPIGKSWRFPGIAVVTVVRGRVSERLDRAVLARLGVSPDVLDKATVRDEGKPSVRITRDEETT